MKSRALRERLGIPKDSWIICEPDDTYCWIGNGYIPDMIRIVTSTGRVDLLKYLDPACLKLPDKLVPVLEELKRMSDSGELREFTQGNDEIENPISVFFAEDGTVVEEVTDESGWPNVTHTGKVMYENTAFKTRKEAAQYGMEQAKSYTKFAEEEVKKLEDQKETWKRRGRKYEEHRKAFKRILHESD